MFFFLFDPFYDIGFRTPIRDSYVTLFFGKDNMIPTTLSLGKNLCAW